MAVERSRDTVAALRQAHEARLRVLRLRAAREGAGAPPEVLTEIEDIEQTLAELDATMQTVRESPIAPDMVEALRPVERYQLLYSHIMRIDADMIHCQRELAGVQRFLNQLRPWVIISAMFGATALVLVLLVLIKVY